MQHPWSTRSAIAVAVIALVMGVGAPGAGAAPPSGTDGFLVAPLLPAGNGDYTGNNNTATAQSGEVFHAGSEPGASVWWTLRRSRSMTVRITTRGSGFDTVLAVYRGTTVRSLTEVASNDDMTDGIRWSQVQFSAQPGVTYRIVVDGYHAPPNRRGNYVLRVRNL